MITTDIKKEKKLEYTPSTVISFRYSIIAFIITIIMMFIVPKILNYGPGTINTLFDIQMPYISYTTQFSILAIIIILGIIILTKLLLKDIDAWFKDTSKGKFLSLDRLNKIRKKCMNLPYTFFAIEITIPFIAAVVLLSLTRSHSPIMISKMLILLISFALFLSVVSFIFSKDLYDTILAQTYVEGFDIGKRITLKKRIFLLIFPIFLASILLVSLIGYSCSVIEKENIIFNTYSNYLSQIFDTNKIYSKEEIISKLKELKLLNSSDTSFILNSDDTVEIIYGTNVSNSIIEYTKQLSDLYNGRIYDSYGVDTQGSILKLNTLNGYCYVGILYDVYSETTFSFLCTTILSLIIIISIILYVFSNSLSQNLNQISKGFEKIYNNTDTSTLLPVISNDEIGDLVIAFNNIQKLNSTQIETIKGNQQMLIERERLASLGQMVGGIAHSLKTPIFSMSGGLEGLSDLIKEFDESIADSMVTDQDMHEIAQDMRIWIDKMKTHLSYMSELITTVKGQAVNLSGDDKVPFTISELFNHTNILMKHELQNSLITLNIKNSVDDTVIITGNINSLVQVLNNLISNAIQSYNKEPNKEIDLSATLEKKKIIIMIKDYGPGLPKKVKNKLFKEMITTKGKEGTGLGLFMSYSMIKAKFNGDITFETSKNGTTFYIKLPL